MAEERWLASTELYTKTHQVKKELSEKVMEKRFVSLFKLGNIEHLGLIRKPRE